MAEYIKRSSPTVCVAVKRLEEGGYIERQLGVYITLTKKGEEVAERLFEIHSFLTDVFVKLGVSPQVAEQDACRMEHIISEESYQKIREHLKKKHCEASEQF